MTNTILDVDTMCEKSVLIGKGFAAGEFETLALEEPQKSDTVPLVAASLRKENFFVRSGELNRLKSRRQQQSSIIREAKPRFQQILSNSQLREGAIHLIGSFDH